MNTTELTNKYKYQKGKMTIFVVFFLNRDLGTKTYKCRIKNEDQEKEFIKAIRAENEFIDYIRYHEIETPDCSPAGERI